MGFPSQLLTSRSSSVQLKVSGTSSVPTLFTVSHISDGVANPMLRSLAHAGIALRNSRMLLDKGCAMPRAESSMKRFIIFSSSFRFAILSTYLSANNGNSSHSLLLKRRDMSSLRLTSQQFQLRSRGTRIYIMRRFPAENMLRAFGKHTLEAHVCHLLTDVIAVYKG